MMERTKEGLSNLSIQGSDANGASDSFSLHNSNLSGTSDFLNSSTRNTGKNDDRGDRGKTDSGIGEQDWRCDFHTKPPTAAEDKEVLRIVERLEIDVSSGNYIRFLNEFDHRGTGGTSTTWTTEERVVLEGLRLFRYHVVKNQLSDPGLVVLTGEGWVKTIKGKFTAFEDSRRVASDAILTFLTLSSLPGNYKSLIVRRGGIDCALKVLDTRGDDKEACNLACALILSLSSNEKEGLNASSMHVEAVIHRLVSLISNGGCGSDYALRVLFQFTFHRKKLPDSGKSLSHFVTNAFRGDKKSIPALFSVMKRENIREPTVEAAVSLIWRLSVPKEELDDEDGCQTSTDAIETIISSMDSFDSIAIREANCGILANMLIRKNFPVDLARKTFSSIQGFLERAESIDEGLATCALHAICNMLENPTMRTNLFSDDVVIEIIIDLMKRHPKAEELIEFACLAIGRAARNNQGIKESFMSLGAFDQVIKAFEEYVTNRGDDASLDVKDASLCAFGALTGCMSGAQAAFSTGLVDIFETLLAVETDRDFAVVLDVIISNIRTCSANNELSMGYGAVLRQEPYLFSKHIEMALNDSDVLSLIQAMIGARQTQLEMAFCSNEAFLSFISAMSRFSTSVQVQERGCALLAELYFNLQYPTNTSTTIQGPWDPQNQVQALYTICNAMNTHRDDSGAQINGCVAIVNMLHPVSEPGCDLLVRHAISPMIEIAFKAVLECLRIHESDLHVQKIAMSALAVSISVAQTEDFRPWAPRAVRQLSNSLTRVSAGHPIQPLSLNVLITIEETHPSIKSDYNSSHIDLLLALACSSIEEVSSRSSALLSALLRNESPSTRQIMESHSAIERVLSIMESKQDKVQVQLNMYSILQSLVGSNPEFSAAVALLIPLDILSTGITSYDQYGKIVISSCKILSSIIGHLDKNVFASSKSTIEYSLVRGLEIHLENSDVESAILAVLCACCDCDEDFRHHLLEETKIRMISNVMQLNLGSIELQSIGCELLSKLSVLGAGKEMIGSCGGISAITNALLAHNDSQEVQRTGLTALKNVATAAKNKPMIQEMQSETAVIYALWIHYRDPEVTSIALSALNNIAVDSIARSVAKMNDQVLTIVITVMQSFPIDEMVQKNACFYLKTCSYLPENVRMMRTNREDLLPLLLQAGDTFPKSCLDRANAIVTKLTSD